jgi:hypothetical protein
MPFLEIRPRGEKFVTLIIILVNSVDKLFDNIGRRRARFAELELGVAIWLDSIQRSSDMK